MWGELATLVISKGADYAIAKETEPEDHRTTVYQVQAPETKPAYSTDSDMVYVAVGVGLISALVLVVVVKGD